MSEPVAEVQQQFDQREATLNRMAAEHYGLMYRVAYRILRSPQDAEEGVHNAWVNLCRASRLPDMHDERAYLAQAVRREAILLWKKHRRFPAAAEGAEMHIEDLRLSPEQAATGTQMQAQLRRQIGLLPPKERSVVVLWYREGLSLVEIAEVLQVPEGTVRRRFMQAKANLKPMFAARQRSCLEVVAGEGSAR